MEINSDSFKSPAYFLLLYNELYSAMRIYMYIYNMGVMYTEPLNRNFFIYIYIYIYIRVSDLIYLLTTIGLTPGGSSTVHIYTQTVHRTTQ